jgi:hypothetical protein
MIRTVSQMQKAAKATPNIKRAMAIPAIIPAVAWGREVRIELQGRDWDLFSHRHEVD